MLKELIVATASALALASSCGGIALAQQSTTVQLAQAGKISAEDQEFLTKAIEAGAADVQISQLALERSLNEQVRKFAERMVQDHTAANQKLMTPRVPVIHHGQSWIRSTRPCSSSCLSSLEKSSTGNTCKNRCKTIKRP